MSADFRDPIWDERNGEEPRVVTESIDDLDERARAAWFDWASARGFDDQAISAAIAAIAREAVAAERRRVVETAERASIVLDEALEHLSEGGRKVSKAYAAILPISREMDALRDKLRGDHAQGTEEKG